MFRFVHSADWQLGARFTQFGAKGAALREARLVTLRRALEVARQREVDAFIAAGDVFEDSQVDESLVSATVQLFSEFPTVLIFLLPGNHDPFSGPGSVWLRRPFVNAPKHIRILGEATAIELDGAFLVASPLHQKMSSLDPSLKLSELASNLPVGKVKVGVTHGSPAIPGKHQPNDFPIALNAASRAGLDYLAIGHWHNWLDVNDGGRVIMPGTPEPDSFDHKNCGYVAYVEIDSGGATPRIEQVTVASLRWKEMTFDFLSEDASRTSLGQSFADLASDAGKTVVRVVLAGSATPRQISDVRVWLDRSLAPFLVGQISDKSSIVLSAAELQDLQVRHPILSQVLADLDQLETLATGRAPVANVTHATPLTLAEAQDLLASAKIDLTALTAEQLTQTRQLLLQTMQDAAL